MTWDYRVVVKNPENPPEREFSLHEVYYDKNNMIVGWISAPSAPFGCDYVESLWEELDMMQAACKKPVLAQQQGTEELVEWTGYLN